MKILHVASFVGNIGDNASHLGFYKILDRYFSDYSLEKLEIRQFYKNYKYGARKYFDESFVALANKYDLVVIGGGGFLDYWVPGSASGTTIDITPILLSKIRVPTLITSMGCFPHKHVPEENIDKFRVFLDSINANPNIFIALRNDGSIESVRRDFGDGYVNNLTEVLDSGFFYDVDAHCNPGFCTKKYIAFNISNDQIDLLSSMRGKIDKDKYYKELAVVVRRIVDELGMDIVFIPHIYSDLTAISHLLAYMDDFLIRNHITVAPCIQGDLGANYNFSLYRESEAVIATRLHANVCSFAMGKTVVGLVALDRVKYLHDSICSDNYYSVDHCFSDNVCYALTKNTSSLKIGAEVNSKKNITLGFYESVFKGL